MASNSDVIYAWNSGRPAAAGNLSTTGDDLFSYRLKIGFTSANGEKIVIDYTSGSGHFRSMTTSQHVGLARRIAADHVLDPELLAA